MPTQLSLEEMIEVTDIHTVYEFTHEIEPLMATVSADPCWIMEPIGCRIVGTEAVAKMYQGMFPLIGAMDPPPSVTNTWFADDGFAGETRTYKPGANGETVESSSVSWCQFDGDLVGGEGNYFEVEAFKYVMMALGDDFFRLPGVTTTAPNV